MTIDGFEIAAYSNPTISANAVITVEQMHITHLFPEFGYVTVPLHKESEELYSVLLLKSHKEVELRRLERLDHLGELRNVLHCGHHSRLEYLYMQLYLIHYFKRFAHAPGLACKVRFPNNTFVSSGEELLKMWAMLSEYGHLYGIYEAERFWLKKLNNDAIFRANFLRLFNTTDSRRLATRIIDNQEIFSFYRILSWLFLRRRIRKAADGNHKTVLRQAQSYLLALIDESVPGSTLQHCKEMFSRIRKLSYLFLDLARLPVELKFNPTFSLQNFTRDAEYYLGSEGEHFGRVLGPLQEYLLEKVYCSRDASKYKLETMRIYSAHYDKQTTTNRINASPKNVWERFLNLRAASFTERSRDWSKWRHYIRIRIVPMEHTISKRYKIFDAENKFRQAISADSWDMLLSIYQVEDKEWGVLDIFSDNNYPLEGEVTVFGYLVEFLRDYYEAYVFDPVIFNIVAGDQIVKIVEVCTSKFFQDRFHIRTIREEVRGPAPVAILQTEKERDKWVGALGRVGDSSELDADKRMEVQALADSVARAKRGTIVALNARIIIESKAREHIAEFDGFFLRMNRGTLELNFIEAKSSRSGASSRALRQLRKGLRRLGASEEMAGKIAQKSDRYAYATVKFENGRRWSARP